MTQISHASLFIELIENPKEVLIQRFLDEFGDITVNGQAVRHFLRREQKEARISGLRLYVFTQAPGVQPARAYIVGAWLLAYLLKYSGTLSFSTSEMRQTQVSVLKGYCEAAFHESRVTEIQDAIHAATDNWPTIINEPLYWESVVISARGLLRQFQFTQAQNILSCVPPHVRDDISYAIAHEVLVSFDKMRFRVEPCLSTEKRTAGILNHTLDRLQQGINQYHHLGLKLGDQTTSTDTNELNGLIAGMRTLLAQRLPFKKKLKDIAILKKQLMTKWEAMTHLQPGDSFNLRSVHELSSTTEEVTLLGSLIDLQQHRLSLTKSLPWTIERNDCEGECLLRWCLVLTDEAISRMIPSSDIQRTRNLQESIHLLMVRLRDFRAREPSHVFKAGLSNYYPGLLPKAYHAHDPALAHEVSEFVKGRSLLAIRQDAEFSSRKAIGQLIALGPHTHYLSYNISNGTNQIFASLLCANSELRIFTLPLTPKYLRELYPWINPETWRLSPSLFHSSPNIQNVLSPLLHPLEVALDQKLVQPGDHICLCADDPVYLIPIPYLLLNHHLAIKTFSFSHVRSLSDARAIAASPVITPTTGLGLFIAHCDERNYENKYQSFCRLQKHIHTYLTHLESHDATTWKRDDVLTLFKDHMVIHCDTHGYFPDNGNPYEQAGLVVSDGKAPPRGNGHPSFLLTPKHVMENRITLNGSHLSLDACVSGRGKLGEGGDVLGLEYAFRYQGAGSILASHWDVEREQSAKFFKQFYTYWLGKGYTRAQAWRTSILDQINLNDQSIGDASLWCAFSLYGDWR